MGWPMKRDPLVYINLVPSHCADVVRSDTGEVLLTVCSLTGRVAPGDARCIARRHKRYRMVESQRVLDVAVRWAVQRGATISSVHVLEATCSTSLL